MRLRSFGLLRSGVMFDADTPPSRPPAGPGVDSGRRIDLVRAAPRADAPLRSAQLAGEGATAALRRCAQAFDELHRGPVNSADFEAAARRVQHFAGQLEQAMAGGLAPLLEDEALGSALDAYREPARALVQVLNDRLELDAGRPRLFGPVDLPERATAAALALRAALARAEAQLSRLGRPTSPGPQLEELGPSLDRSLAIFAAIAPKLGPQGLSHELSELTGTLAALRSLAAGSADHPRDAPLKERLRARLDAVLVVLDQHSGALVLEAKAGALAARAQLEGGRS